MAMRANEAMLLQNTIFSTSELGKRYDPGLIRLPSALIRNVSLIHFSKTTNVLEGLPVALIYPANAGVESGRKPYNLTRVVDALLWKLTIHDVELNGSSAAHAALVVCRSGISVEEIVLGSLLVPRNFMNTARGSFMGVHFARGSKGDSGSRCWLACIAPVTTKMSAGWL